MGQGGNLLGQVLDEVEGAILRRPPPVSALCISPQTHLWTDAGLDLNAVNNGTLPVASQVCRLQCIWQTEY